MTEEATGTTAGTEEATAAAGTGSEERTYTQKDLDNITAAQEATRLKNEATIARLTTKADEANTAAMSENERALKEAKEAAAAEVTETLTAQHADALATARIEAAVGPYLPEGYTDVDLATAVAAAKARGAETPADAVKQLQAIGLLGANRKGTGPGIGRSPDSGGSGVDLTDADAVQEHMAGMTSTEQRAFVEKNGSAIDAAQQRSTGVVTFAPGAGLRFEGGVRKG